MKHDLSHPQKWQVTAPSWKAELPLKILRLFGSQKKRACLQDCDNVSSDVEVRFLLGKQGLAIEVHSALRLARPSIAQNPVPTKFPKPAEPKKKGSYKKGKDTNSQTRSYFLLYNARIGFYSSKGSGVSLTFLSHFKLGLSRRIKMIQNCL